MFAHAFRYLREFGGLGRTYHVGEDFYDLIDGLRAIDEAITFFELGKNDRLGHALALGVNPYDYYNHRRYNIVNRIFVIPVKQNAICHAHSAVGNSSRFVET